MPFTEAVDYCIRNGILADFLSKNRAEAIAVSIYEYDEEKHMRNVRQEGRKETVGLSAHIAFRGCTRFLQDKFRVYPQ